MLNKSIEVLNNEQNKISINIEAGNLVFNLGIEAKNNNIETKITLTDNKINKSISYENVNKFKSISSYPESIYNTALNNLANRPEYGIKTNDLIKYNNFLPNTKEAILDFETKLRKNNKNIMPDYLVKIKLKLEEALDYVFDKTTELNNSTQQHIRALNNDIGIIKTKECLAIIDSTHICGKYSFSGENYIYNTKLENVTLKDSIVIDSAINNVSLTNCIVDSSVLFDVNAKYCKFGDGNKVVLEQDKILENSFIYKKGSQSITKNISNIEVETVRKRIFKEVEKNGFLSKFIRPIMIGIVAVSGLIGVAHADTSNTFTPKTTSQSIVAYANSNGINLQKFDIEQKKFMNVEQVVQRGDDGCVTAVENHSNKLLPGIGYLTEDNSPDLDYVKISTTNNGKTWIINTNNKMVEVKADSKILSWNGDVPYLNDFDSLNPEIKTQQKQLAKNNTEREIG